MEENKNMDHDCESKIEENCFEHYHPITMPSFHTSKETKEKELNNFSNIKINKNEGTDLFSIEMDCEEYDKFSETVDKLHISIPLGYLDGKLKLITTTTTSEGYYFSSVDKRLILDFCCLKNSKDEQIEITRL